MADEPTLTPEQLQQLRDQAEAGQQAATERDELHTQLTTAQEAARGATGALLDASRAANPTIPAELITGETPDDIAASIERGKGIVEQVTTANAGNDADDEKPKTPGSQAGAPARGDPQPPERARGISRIAFALRHPGPGMTE